MSFIVTRPRISPYSSTTSAMWRWFSWKLVSCVSSAVPSGTKYGSRMISRRPSTSIISRRVQHLAHVQDAHRVVQAALAHHEPRVVRRAELVAHVVQVVGDVQVLDL